MISAFLKDQTRPGFGGFYVLLEVGMIDLVPYASGGLCSLLHGEARVAVHVSRLILKRYFPQAQEPLQVPLPDILLLRVYVDREVEVVGYEDFLLFGRVRDISLQNV